jgi:hypothetical protein
MDCLRVNSAAFVLSWSLDFSDRFWKMAMISVSLTEVQLNRKRQVPLNSGEGRRIIFELYINRLGTRTVRYSWTLIKTRVKDPRAEPTRTKFYIRFMSRRSSLFPGIVLARKMRGWLLIPTKSLRWARLGR